MDEIRCCFFPLVGKDQDVSMDIHLSGTIFFVTIKKGGESSEWTFYNYMYLPPFLFPFSMYL